MSGAAEETALWRAVINQAIADATANVEYADPKKHLQLLRSRSKARNWLTGMGRDFCEVCTLAEFEPGAVRDAAFKLAASGWPAQDYGVRQPCSRP